MNLRDILQSHPKYWWDTQYIFPMPQNKILIQWVLNFNLLWKKTWSHNVLVIFGQHLISTFLAFPPTYRRTHWNQPILEIRCLWVYVCLQLHLTNLWGKEKVLVWGKILAYSKTTFFLKLECRVNICSMICPHQAENANSVPWEFGGYTA